MHCRSGRAAYVILFISILAVSITAAGGCSKQPAELAWTFTSNAPIYSTPLVTNDLIVFGNESGTVTAITRNGEFRWRYPASMNVISSPKTNGSLIFFGSINYSFYAIDTQGREVWKYPTKKPIKSDPLIVGNVVYFTSYDGHVYAANTEDRSTLWVFPPKPVPPPAPAEGGAPVPEQPPAITPAEFSYSSPAIANGVIYVGNLDSYVYAIDAKTGNLKWRFKTEDGVTSSPMIDSGIVYIGSNDGNVYALDAAKGTKVWAFKTGGWVNSSPKLMDGAIYVGSNDKNMYVLDARDGSLKGKFTAKGPVISYPVFYKNYVIVCGGQDDGTVYLLDRATLKVAFFFKTNAKIEADPVIEGNMMYVGSFDRNLYAFKLNGK